MRREKEMSLEFVNSATIEDWTREQLMQMGDLIQMGTVAVLIDADNQSNTSDRLLYH